jgi:hypothetical protein
LGAKAHGRIGCGVAGNGGVALRTRRWIKTLKPIVPGSHQPTGFGQQARWRSGAATGVALSQECAGFRLGFGQVDDIPDCVSAFGAAASRGAECRRIVRWCCPARFGALEAAFGLARVAHRLRPASIALALFSGAASAVSPVRLRAGFEWYDPVHLVCFVIGASVSCRGGLLAGFGRSAAGAACRMVASAAGQRAAWGASALRWSGSSETGRAALVARFGVWRTDG